jgi:hypothetical protein
VADPTPEPDFVRELRELVEAGTPLRQAEARRHHYVPSFLLARWAAPQKREGKLAALTVATGRMETTKPDNVERQAVAVKPRDWRRDVTAEAAKRLHLGP